MSNQSLTSAPEQSCPLCGGSLATGELDRDHIFGQAFGSRVTVVTHRACNNGIGAGSEGNLHKANSVMNFIKLARGLPHKPFVGIGADGTTYDTDLINKTFAPSQPIVAIEDNGARVTFQMRGAPEQLRRRMKDLRKHWPLIPQFDQLPPNAVQKTKGPSIDVYHSIQLDLDAALQVFQKASLGAGVKMFGGDFAIHPLAIAIRDATLDNERLAPDGLRAVWARGIQMVGDISGLLASSLPAVLPAPNHQVTYVPFPSTSQTAVFVHILGFPIIPWGIIIPQPLPQTSSGHRLLPIMLRENVDERYVIVDLSKIVIDETLRIAEEVYNSKSESGRSPFSE